MTRHCVTCRKRKTLDQFDLTVRFAQRCRACSDSWGPARIKLRILLRELGSVEAVAAAIGYAPSTTRRYFRQPDTITPRASQAIRRVRV